MVPVDAFVIAAKRSSRADFSSRFPGCFLLIEPFAPQRSLAFTTTGASDRIGEVRAIARLEKRKGANAFTWMVTIGRAQNNDIVIPASDVSKFHASLREAEGGAWEITDAGSTYGTALDGAKIESKAPAELAPGAAIELGSVRMSFHTSDTLYTSLRALEV